MRGKTNHLKWLMCVLFLVGAVHSAAAGRIIYVDDDADGANNGLNWGNAVNSLQDALLLAYFSDKPVEIHVAQGVYTPDRGLGIMQGDSSVSFQLINKVTIKGGYAARYGHGGDVRDVNLYKSILSGDLNANDSSSLTTIEDNSYHVITSTENDTTAVLDGFTISGSSLIGAGSSPNNHSSGMYNYMSSPKLIDCNFTGNMAAERGAGMYNNGGNPVLLNCAFLTNSAPDGGAGMYNVNSSPILTNCVFNWNTVGGRGAGMYNVNSNPALLNCVFTSNSAGMNGGGIYNEKSIPTLTNCTFTHNSAGDGGGGIYNEESVSMLADIAFRGNTTGGNGGGIYSDNSSKLTSLNCIFSGNSAQISGGGLYNNFAGETSLTNCIFSDNNTRDGGGGLENLGNMTLSNCTFNRNLTQDTGGGISNIQDGRMTLVNCILWDDTPNEIYAESVGIGHGRVTTGVGVTYSNVQSGWSGDGNIDVDPLFADPNHGDFHLKSYGGRWDPISQSWFVDDTSSPCIDAGSPYESIGLERFPNGDRVNIGAYGGTPEASLSPRLLPRLPGQASNPSPVDGAENVDVNVTLSWTAGVNAVAHNVYFGTDIEELLPVSIQQTTNEIKLTALDHEVTYYWRVDEVDSSGKAITGEVWTFTTTNRPKGRVCFTAETGVWVNSALVPISKAVTGQITCGINSYGKILEVQEHNGIFTCYDVLLESGNSISVAENHYFLAASGQWLSLKNLKAGIKLKTSKGSIGIKSITKRPMPYVGNVYNLNIAGSDRYLVGKDAVIVRDF